MFYTHPSILHLPSHFKGKVHSTSIHLFGEYLNIFLLLFPVLFGMLPFGYLDVVNVESIVTAVSLKIINNVMSYEKYSYISLDVVILCFLELIFVFMYNNIYLAYCNKTFISLYNHSNRNSDHYYIIIYCLNV